MNSHAGTSQSIPQSQYMNSFHNDKSGTESKRPQNFEQGDYMKRIRENREDRLLGNSSVIITVEQEDEKTFGNMNELLDDEENTIQNE